MLGDISGAANIYVVTGYTDMRKSIDGLCAIVMDQLKVEPDSHSIYLFCGRRCGRIKVLLREPDGYVLLYKRLDVVQGKYRWPRNRSEVRPITWQQFNVSSGLAAHVMYGKFINALPYYRQENDFDNRFGVKIGRGIMAHWTIYCAENYFSPMTEYFHRLLSGRKFVAADETPIQVLKEAGRRPQSKSYVWLFCSGDDGLPPIIIYQYHPTRNGDAAAEFFQGSAPGTYINADGYAGYNKLKDFKRCCYAYIRRYFLEAIPKGKEKDYTDPAVQGLLYCNKLFEYERAYRKKGFSYKQIYNRRLKDQKPVVEAFAAWIDKQSAPNGSRLSRALTYVGNQRPYMMTYLEDGRCNISNNLSENSICCDRSRNRKKKSEG